MFQAALTCRGPRSKSFFGTEPKPTDLSLRKELEGLNEKEEEQNGGGGGSMHPVSPANSMSVQMPSVKVGRGRGGDTLVMHGRSRMAIDPRIPTMPGRSTMDTRIPTMP